MHLLLVHKKCLIALYIFSLSTFSLALCYLIHYCSLPTSKANIQSHNFIHVTTSNLSTVHISNKQQYIKVVETSSNISNGFILVSKYFEQQIGAAINMLTLTKWARNVGAFPVEPFVKDSTFSNIVENPADSLRFSDYFDINLWNQQSVNVGAMPLTPWETFMANKPNRLILVKLSHFDSFPKLAYVDNQITRLLNSTNQAEFLNFETAHDNFIKGCKFTIVRRVLIAFANHPPIHLHQFNDIIYGNFDPRSVVVWFQVWEGIARALRIKVIEEEYQRSEDVFNMLHTSKRIVQDSMNYAKRIMNSSFGNYVSVSFRSVKRAKYIVNKRTGEDQADFFRSCIQRVKRTIDNLNSTGGTFLALDLGRFGDNKAGKFISKDVIRIIETNLFRTLYNDRIRMKEWEREFVDVANGVDDSGYIAAMQSTLLENSRCLVMFGGDSNFQRNLLTNFQHKSSNPCVREVCYIQ